VVCSIGVHSAYFIPEFKGQERFKGAIYHSGEMKNFKEKVEGKRVVVLGGARGATDCTWLAMGYGAKSSDMVCNVTRWGAVIKPENFMWGFMHPIQMVWSRFGTMCQGPSPLAHHLFFHKYFSWLINFCWNELEAKQAIGCHKDLVPREKGLFVKDLYSASARHEGCNQFLKDGKVTLTQGVSITELEENHVVLSNGKKLECDVLISATGYRQAFNPLLKNVPQAQNVPHDGLWMYRW
jgi:lysine/ornithine N-monooxygenase